MTVSIRISQSEAPRRVQRGGFLAALAGETGYEPGGSTDIEITSDESLTRKGVRDFVSAAGPVAAETFRTAVLGEHAAIGWIDEAVAFSDALAVGDTEDESAPESVSVQADGPSDQAIRIRVDSPVELAEYGIGSVIVDAYADAWQRRSDGLWARPTGTHRNTHHSGTIAYADKDMNGAWFPAIVVYVHGGN